MFIESHLIVVVSNGIELQTIGPMCMMDVALSLSDLHSKYLYNPDVEFIIRHTDEDKKRVTAMREENNREAVHTPARIAEINRQMEAERVMVQGQFKRREIDAKERNLRLGRIHAYGTLEIDSLPKMLA
jgi:hypothetical protein